MLHKIQLKESQVIAMELEEVENQFQVPSEPHQEPLLDDREMLQKIQLKESQVKAMELEEGEPVPSSL